MSQPMTATRTPKALNEKNRVRPSVEALEDRTVPVINFGTDPFGTSLFNPAFQSFAAPPSSLQGLIDLALPGIGTAASPFAGDIQLLQGTGLLDNGLIQSIFSGNGGFDYAPGGPASAGFAAPSSSLQGLIDLALPGIGTAASPFAGDIQLLQGTGLLDNGLIQSIFSGNGGFDYAPEGPGSAGVGVPTPAPVQSLPGWLQNAGQINPIAQDLLSRAQQAAATNQAGVFTSILGSQPGVGTPGVQGAPNATDLLNSLFNCQGNPQGTLAQNQGPSSQPGLLETLFQRQNNGPARTTPPVTPPPAKPPVTPPAPAGVQDVTGHVSVAVGPARRARRTGRVQQQLTLVNNGADVQGPVRLVLSGLSGKARLSGQTGTAVSHGQPGSPYVTVSANGLKAGQRVIVTLTFGGPAREIRYDARVLAGNGVV